MGHVLLATPTIPRLALHDALARGLRRRGHHVTTLVRDPVTRRCYEAHGLRVQELSRDRAANLPRSPLPGLAAREARLHGRSPAGAQSLLARSRRRLAREMGGLMRSFEIDLPDLVVLIDARDGFGRMAHWVAREFGCELVHLGTGLLPGTIQRDTDGIDGDSSVVRRTAGFYRSQRADRELLDSVLAASLGGLPPRTDRARTAPWPPDLFDQLSALFAACLDGTPLRGLERLAAWNRLAASDDGLEPTATRLPVEGSYVGVLLQDPRDPRIRLDLGDDALREPPDLVGAMRRALCTVGDPTTPIVVVAPDTRTARALEDRTGQQGPPVHVVGPASAALVATTASLLWTVNHPMGLLGVLAGTPTLHLGITPWGVPGAAQRIELAALPEHLAELPGPDTGTLRARVATRLLRDDHVWCDPDRPDPNGVRGILEGLEQQLQRTRPKPELGRYRPGPAWAPGA